ncbi:MAG: MYG1 family protein [Sulfuricella denitrificans]|nr:MYG1 family protein [Sulfuricella denitrificans]
MNKESRLHAALQHSGAIAATHSGSFHADEVLAAAVLRLASPSIPILRTRDPAELDAADIVFDVGRIFDQETCRFDHHQLEFSETRENGIPFSSFGLIWRELGAELCGSTITSSRVDRLLVQGVDAVDCGISLSKETPSVNVMSISSIIGGFNPGWQDDTGPEARNAAFERAVACAISILQNVIREARGLEAAQAVVEQGILLEAGRILVLDRSVPWHEAVLGSSRYAQLLYVVSPDTQTKWHVHTVPGHAGSFSNRKSLPAAWAGLDNEELDRVTGLTGCVFCHRARFVAGHGTKSGAVELARLALRD